MDNAEQPFWRRAVALLRDGPFRRYIIGSAISDTGTWMQVMAQGWVMSSLTNRGFYLGLAAAAAGVPTILLAMKGGEAADRYDKRKILIWTQIVQTILAVILGLLVFTGRIQIWHVIVLALCLGTCIAFEMPAINALVPELVTKDQIATAIALDRSVFHGSRLVGPSVAGVIVGWWGAASAFFSNAFTFFALIIALASLPPRTLGTAEEEEQRKSGFKEGLIYVRNDRTILSMIVLIGLSTIFVFPFLSVMLPLYVRNILQLGPTPMGYLMAVSGSGSLFGALGLLSVPRHLRFKFMSGAVVIVGLSLCLMSRSHSFVVSAIAMGVLAIGLSANFGLASTIVQERAPDPLRGRISAIFGLSFFGLTPVGSLITPAFADLIGLRSALVVGGVLYATFAVVVLSFAGRVGCEKTPRPVVAPEPEAQAAPAA
ncbi:MAG: MFS transporter [Verrucomicrobiota bacterium]|nr:MFS transporter [Verrucomicrobiota bacterium]